MGRKKPGLWHGKQHVEIEDVNPRMSASCSQCGEIPKKRRLHIQVGSGRSGKSIILCRKCGLAWLSERREEVGRAVDYLSGGDVPIRS